MPELQTREVQKFVAIYPVTEESWESIGSDVLTAQIYGMFRDEVETRGELVGDVTQQIEFESRIGGLRLFSEFEGVDLPPMVAVRMSACVIPNDEAQAELDALAEEEDEK